MDYMHVGLVDILCWTDYALLVYVHLFIHLFKISDYAK